jgi:sugar lactone lactonase YvrE
MLSGLVLLAVLTAGLVTAAPKPGREKGKGKDAPKGAPKAEAPKAAPVATAGPQVAKLLVALPGYCNTPDGMALLADGKSFLLSIPNFNNEKQPPLLVKVGADNKANAWMRFPTPYPGLPKGLDRIRPMGMCMSAAGNLYLADMQYMKDPNGKSRLWKIAAKDGHAGKMVLVAKGFNVSNGIAIRGDYVYVTESVLEEGSHPLTSAVLRFKLDEENVTLKTPLKSDPHVIATYISKNNDWRFGADGICFDSKGNLYVGLFGEGQLWKITFDKDGKVASNKLFAEAPGKMINCDGMSCDLKTDKLYVADSANNAIQVVSPDGTIVCLAKNGDVKDKKTGLLDQPCEALVRGDEVVASNMDWAFPKFVNSGHQLPATLSVLKIER